MVTPGKKPNVKPRKVKWIDDYLKNNSGYDYYYEDSFRSVKDLLGNPGFNCSDYDPEEMDNILKGRYVRENIARKATPEELEWMKKQEPVTDPEVLEELRPALEWLSKYVFYDTDDKDGEE